MQEEKYSDGVDEGDTDTFFANLVTSLEAVIVVHNNLNLKTELW